MDHAARAIRLVLVDDHASFRQALAFLFDRQLNFEVSAQVGTLAEAQEFLDHQENPGGIDAAVVDLGLPDGKGADFVASLRSRNPSATVLVLSATLSPENFARALEAGASGVLDKLSGLEEIIATTECHRAGAALPAQREVIEMLRLYVQREDESEDVQADVESLTLSEREILKALAEGLDSEETSRKLDITLEEEEDQVAGILDKLDAHSRLHAIAIAARYGMVELR